MSRRPNPTPSFIAAQRVAQGAYFDRTVPGHEGYLGAGYRLGPDQGAFNFAPTIRDRAAPYFKRHKIAWHIHANHGLSSQTCCLNFLMPLATRPDLLAKVVGNALGIPTPEMLPVEDGAPREPWFVAFEWVGKADYLGEGYGAVPTRGKNATSADAYVRFRHENRIEGLLIEWKYTETYGAPIAKWNDPGAMAKRGGWYLPRIFAPAGPIRSDLGLTLEQFYWDPFYQLMRQQTLAARMQEAKEDGVQRVRVLHISPSGNRLLHRVTAPALRRFGEDAFEVFSHLLVRPDDFVSRSTEDVFGPALTEAPDDPWAAYLRERYSFLTPGAA